MTDFALPAHFVEVVPARPARRRSAGRDPLLAKAMIVSGIGHAALAIALVCGPLLFQSAPAARPLIIDVDVVDISELETVLPPAVVGRSDDPKARARIPDPVDLKPKSAPQKPKEVIQSPSATVAKKSVAPLESTAAVAPPVGESTLGGGSEAIEKARVSYRDIVATKLARAKRYPERAVRNQITGRGVIRIKIDAKGAVVSSNVAESTQSEILDDELLRMVDRAAPFPAFPQAMSQTELSLLIPVTFRLNS